MNIYAKKDLFELNEEHISVVDAVTHLTQDYKEQFERFFVSSEKLKELRKLIPINNKLLEHISFGYFEQFILPLKGLDKTKHYITLSDLEEIKKNESDKLDTLRETTALFSDDAWRLAAIALRKAEPCNLSTNYIFVLAHVLHGALALTRQAFPNVLSNIKSADDWLDEKTNVRELSVAGVLYNSWLS